jgi:type II secretory pathway component PulM
MRHRELQRRLEAYWLGMSDNERIALLLLSAALVIVLVEVL